MNFYRDLGAHRTRLAEILPQPRADDGVHGVAAGAADRAGLRVRRKNQGRGNGFVDQDHSVESDKVREMFHGITAGPHTFNVIEYDSVPLATHDLQTGLVRARGGDATRFFAALLSARPAAHRVHRR